MLRTSHSLCRVVKLNVVKLPVAKLRESRRYFEVLKFRETEKKITKEIKEERQIKIRLWSHTSYLLDLGPRNNYCRAEHINFEGNFFFVGRAGP